MAKRYARINWQNAPSTATPRNAANLNIMDKGINDIDDAVETLSYDTILINNCATLGQIADVMIANKSKVGIGHVGNLNDSSNLKTLLGNPPGFTNYTLVIAKHSEDHLIHLYAVMQAGTQEKRAQAYITSNGPTWTWTGWIDIDNLVAQENTWIPTVYGSTTPGVPVYTQQVGHYYKIGKLVFVSAVLALSSKGGMAGNVMLPLPFTVGPNVRAAMDIGFLAGVNYTAYKQVIGAFNQGANTANLYFIADNASVVQINASAVSDGFAIRFSGCFVLA